MANTVQTNYQINPNVGFAGDIAQPNFPHAFDSGVAQVPSNGRKPRPGDALYYDRANSGWAVPSSAAQVQLISGICTYRKDVVQTTAQVTEFDDGDEIEVGVFGSFWVIADAALEYGDRLTFDTTNFKWERNTTSTTGLGSTATSASTNKTAIDNIIAAIGRVPITCASRRSVAANGVAIARIGYGRVF